MLRNIWGMQMRGRERKIISWWSDDERVGGRCCSWHDKISTVTSFFNLSWIISKQLILCVKTTVRAGLSWSAFVRSFWSSVQGFCTLPYQYYHRVAFIKYLLWKKWFKNGDWFQLKCSKFVCTYILVSIFCCIWVW